MTVLHDFFLQRSASFPCFYLAGHLVPFMCRSFNILLPQMFQEGPTGASTVAQEGYVCT